MITENMLVVEIEIGRIACSRAIYALHLQGCGQKQIARRLNAIGCKTLAQIMTERLGYDSQKPHKTLDRKFPWTYASVKDVLAEEAYHNTRTTAGCPETDGLLFL